jgi:hypothetical protein
MNIGRIRNGAILISAGVVLLFNTTGHIPWSVWLKIFSLWPVALIAIGIELLLKKTKLSFVTLLSPLLFFAAILGPAFLFEHDMGELYRTGRTYHWSQELDSTVTEITATVRMHSGNLEISSGTDDLVSAELDYYKRKPLTVWETAEPDSSAALRITDRERKWFKWEWNRGRLWRSSDEKTWEIRLTDLVPVDLRLYLKANDAELNFSEVMIRNLDLDAKSSDVDIRIGNLVDNVTARISSRASEFSIYYPEDMGLRIVNRTRFSFSSLSWLSLEKNEEGLQTPDYEGTERKLTLYLDGSLTKLKLNKYKPFEGI